MIRKKTLILAGTIALIWTLSFSVAKAQTASVFAAGLSQPAKIILTPEGNLIVTETLGAPNMGRVSIIDRFGNRRTLIDGLPSGNDPEGGPTGPTGLTLRGRTLFVAIGSGDGTLAGPIPGTELPNPHPSSPILSSVLAIELSTEVERATQGFTLTLADQFRLAGGGKVRLSNGRGDKISVALVANFPNYVADPLPFFSDNVRHSNPFGLVADGDNLYVADGGTNSVRRVKAATGKTQDVTVFPPRPNPFSFPPVIEAVPDGINIIKGQLLVTLLTGFPFIPGESEVRKVDVKTGDSTTFIGGLSSAIDIVEGSSKGKNTQYYVLEFSTNFLANAPGQLLLFSTPAATPTVVVGGLISPSGMVRDPKTGDIYITEIFTGRIIRVQFP